jgi:DNA polymerase
MSTAVQIAVKTENKVDQLTELYAALERDHTLPFYQERIKNDYQVVLGEGTPAATIMFLGEAPGSREAVFGRPFIGAAGHLLHDLLKLEKIDRKRIYLTNMVKDCLPENRKPSAEASRPYIPYLEREINIIQPMMLVPLGRFAMEFAFHRFQASVSDARINDLHGQAIKGYADYGEIVLFPLYHPAAALYDPMHLRTLAKDFRTLKAVASEMWLLD